MRISLKSVLSQLLCVLIAINVFSCRGGRDDNVIPPVTNPLSGESIGYGVISDSFTHVTVDPDENSESLGYLRRGSIVKIVRRQTVKSEYGYQSWILADDPYGWLKESVMDIYSSESQAKTASELLTGSREQ